MALTSPTSVHPPDKSYFKEAALELSIEESFIEKDWFVTQAIAILSQIQSTEYEIIFTGGTALSKAHGILKRFSEDIDFRVLTNRKSRKELSSFKNKVFTHLRQNGYQFEDHQTKARDGNKYFSVDFKYQSQFQPAQALRPHLQIEFSVRDIQCPAQYLPVSSFLNELGGDAPEVTRIGCIDPIESAADKLSALAWRIPDRRRGDKYDDPAVVRHIHDLAILKEIAQSDQSFPRLVLDSMHHDDKRAKNSAGFADLSVSKKFKQLFDILNTDNIYKTEYSKFVEGVSYANESNIPSYLEALDAVKSLSDTVISSA